MTDTIKTDNHVAVGGVGSYFGITKLPLNLGDIMNKHEYRILEHENMELRSQIFYLNKILDNIEDWLEGERSLTLNPSEITDYDSNDDDIVYGRIECAESLLEQIKKWESEE